MANSKAQVIDKVVEQARTQYVALMESQYVSTKMRVDGVETVGQVEDSNRNYTNQDKNTKTATCMLDVKCKRGSFVEIQESNDDKDYSWKGLISNRPIRTPVDNYFKVLMFNAKARRVRNQLTYDDNGYIIDDDPLIEDDILCYVQRVGTTERRLDAGIDKDSVNEIITTNGYDIKLGDILYVGSEKYKVTDVKELEEDFFYGYITFFRE